VRVSIYYWQDWSPWDFRQWTAPHLTAELTSEDYRTNADPASSCSNHAPPKPGCSPGRGLAKNDLELTTKLFRQFKAEPVNRYLHVENQMIELGYRLLRERNRMPACSFCNSTSRPILNPPLPTQLWPMRSYSRERKNSRSNMTKNRSRCIQATSMCVKD
jgi:hypothetical protein